MIQRLQIEDLISQSSSGVVFRALDTQSGLPVAVRRFFPFGPGGGGLQAAERESYDRAIDLLAGLDHPALRSVVCGGCDPVDGIPFIATEWIDGNTVREVTVKGRILAPAAIELITQALEVSELLSRALGEEAVWLDTDLDTIIVGDAGSGRRFTFWISPLKWMGGRTDPPGLEAIVQLSENVMGWKGRLVSDHAASGLGGWLNWLRNAAPGTTLHEARQSLSALVEASPPPPPPPPVRSPVRVAPPRKMPVKSTNSATPWIVLSVLALVVAGVATWGFHNRRGPRPSIATAVATGTAADAARPADTKPEAARVASSENDALAGNIRPPIAPEPVAGRTAPADPQPLAHDDGDDRKVHGGDKEAVAAERATGENGGATHPPDDKALLMRLEGKQVEIEGVFERFDFSETRSLMYLIFTNDSNWNSARGLVEVAKAPAELSEEALKPLVGKKIRMRGTVEIQTSFNLTRPLLKLEDRASITMAE